MSKFVVFERESCAYTDNGRQNDDVPLKRKRREKLRVPELGHWVRTIRKAKSQTLEAVGAMAGIEKSQLSRIENGANVEVEQYEAIARALGFKNALEMFRAPGDPIMRRLQRYWPLLDDAAKKDVLQLVKGTIDADEV